MRRERVLIGEMIAAAEQAQALVVDVTVEGLAADRRSRDALLWNFTVLGEAAAQIDGEIKEQFPEVSWRQPTQLRNRIVHGYWSVDLEVLHTTASELLPAFVEQLRAVLAALDAETP